MRCEAWGLGLLLPFPTGQRRCLHPGDSWKTLPLPLRCETPRSSCMKCPGPVGLLLYSLLYPISSSFQVAVPTLLIKQALKDILMSGRTTHTHSLIHTLTHPHSLSLSIFAFSCLFFGMNLSCNLPSSSKAYSSPAVKSQTALVAIFSLMCLPGQGKQKQK